MKVVVTGASGFIGKCLTKRLAQEGHSVRTLVRRIDKAEPTSDLDVKPVIGDITNLSSLESAFAGAEIVFHLAGLVGYSKSMHQKMVQANVIGTANVIDVAKFQNVAKLVHMSSVVTVGASLDGSPLNEESPYQLGHLNLGYFETKRRAEEVVIEAAKKSQIHAVCVNPGTVYGPGDATKGSRGVQVKVAQGRFPFYTKGGVNVIHVDDVVDCTIRAAHQGRSGHRYILGGENVTLKTLFNWIAEEAQVTAPRICLPTWLVRSLGGLGDYLESKGLKTPINSETAWTSTMYHWFDSSKAARELGLKPRPARDAVKASVSWMKERSII